MMDDLKQDLWASIEVLKTALASMGAEDRKDAMVGILGITEARLQGFVRGPSSSDAPDDNVGHMLHGHNAPNNDGVLGLATFGATTASTSPSDPPPGIVEVPASRYSTRTSDVFTPTAARDEDDDGKGHMFDGHNAPNNDGVQSLSTDGLVMVASVALSHEGPVRNPGNGAPNIPN
jgi:hypothetical protein